MRRRKCLIGVVAFQGANPKTLQSYMALAFELGRRQPDIDFYLHVIGKKEQFRARNNLVDMAKGWMDDPDDLLLMLDDDMILPQETFERLKNIIDTYPDAGVAGGLYWQRGGGYRPVIMKVVYQNDTVGTQWYAPHEITGGVQQVGIQGGGCMLMPMRAINALMPPVFWVDGIVGTDVHFCSRLNQMGFNCYCDTGLELGHVQEGNVLTGKNLPLQVVKFAELRKDLEESACKYLKLDRYQLESLQLQSVWDLEHKWLEKPRETFDDIKDAYLSIGKIAVVRNVFYGSHSNTANESFSDLIDTVQKGMIDKAYPVLDYGCGIGLAAEILAKGGYTVEAMDLEGSEVLNFLDYRINQYKLSDKISIHPVNSPLPMFNNKYSAIILLDILEHLQNPQEILEAVLTRLIPGGYLHSNFGVMDFKGAEEGVHQHLKNITLREFEAIVKKHGLVSIGTFLYQKKREV